MIMKVNLAELLATSIGVAIVFNTNLIASNTPDILTPFPLT